MRKIKWGVLGTAGIARGCTIPGMKTAENCELYAIAGRNPEKVEAFRQEFGFEKGYNSLQALLEDPQVEAVYIPLSNDLHYEWVLKAVKAKKHVLCEKPLAPTAQQIRELFAAAKENGVLLMEAFAYLHSPLQLEIRDVVRSGKLGDILYMESQFTYSSHDLSNIRMRKETFGGSTYDLGVYNTSQILFMLDKKPEKIQAMADFSEENIDVHTSALLSFGPDCRAQAVCGMELAKGKDRRIDHLGIHGTEGSLVCDAQFNQKGLLSYTVTIGDRAETFTVDTPDNYGLEVAQLGRCITEGEERHVSEAFTIANAEVIDEILKVIGY
ncbi:MAG: Gfo/Idh/MocA family oxidoreductase [Lachnospiraceae bacterium]|nr:Gfo/Idh/MocA family oxidoreductase [Lachnospiraceae bacterium]